MKSHNIIYLGIGILALILIMFFYKSYENKAIYMEESIHTAQSDINKEEKRRLDLFINMVDAVESYNEHETNTLVDIIKARNEAKNGSSVPNMGSMINSLTEAYPDLKSNQNYQTLMKEFSLTENRLAEYRGSYNKFVKSYKRYVRSFPNSIFLEMQGYEFQDFNYYKEEVDNSKATNLFKGR